MIIENGNVYTFKFAWFPFIKKESFDENSWICKYANLHNMNTKLKGRVKGFIWYKLCRSMLNVFLWIFLQTFKVLMIIHEYANKLICIFEY